MPSSGRGVKPPTGTSRHKVRWMRLLSYTPDWIITIALAAVFFSLDYVEGYRRVFSITDTSLLHPFAEHERVPNTALYLIAILAPFVLQIGINLITIRSWWDFHNATLGLILSLALTGSITQFSKITVGRPRPDIISRCIPRAGATDPPLGLSDWTICTSTNAARMRDGFRSFPSGHASLSFAGLGFLAFYLSGKLHLFDRRGHAGKAWLALTPLSGAALVAISRSMDYRHHWHDILVGSILGLVMSYFCYRQYYPGLTSRYSHRPYAPRHTWAGTALSEVQDEDERGMRRHLRSNSTESPDAHRAYRDEAGEEDEELQGTVPRTGAQDLSRTWEEGSGPISEGEARRVQENA